MAGRPLSATTRRVISYLVLHPNDSAAAVARALALNYRTTKSIIRRHPGHIKEAQDALREVYRQKEGTE